MTLKHLRFLFEINRFFFFFFGSAASKDRAITLHQQGEILGRFPLCEFYTHPSTVRTEVRPPGMGDPYQIQTECALLRAHVV